MKLRWMNWALFAALLAATPHAGAQSAKHWFKQGRKAEDAGNTLAAYQDYYRAFQKKPDDEQYRLSYQRVRFDAAAIHVERGERLRDQGDYTGALTEFLRALEIDPSNELASQDIQATKAILNGRKMGTRQAPRTVRQAFQELAPPVQLKPLSNEPLTLHMVADSRIVYRAIAKAAGINVLFDPSYSSRRIQVDLNNVTWYNALRIVAMSSGTFWRPVTSNTIFVAADTRAKHMELDQQAVETFYLHNVAQQNDFTETMTVLRNMFQDARINGVASDDAIVMRGTPDEILLARRLIADLDKSKPEVILDVAVMEVSRDLLHNIGVQLPQTASINFQPSNANITNTNSSSSANNSGVSTPNSSLTLNNLAHLNSTNFAVTIGQAAVNLLLTDNRSRIIQNPQIRISDGQEASLKIGERIPIATGSYQTGAATAIVSSLVNTQFQYINVGVSLNLKPTVHLDGDVSLKSKIEVSATNGSTNIGGITEPIITQRIVDQTIRLKNGEANLLGGILQHQKTLSISGTPGLANLPLIKYLFSTRQSEVTNDEIVFLLVPHVIRQEQLTAGDLREIDTGTANNVVVRPLEMEQPQSAPAGAAEPGAQPKPLAGSATVNSVAPAVPQPPVTAPQAAANALAQQQRDMNSAPPAQLLLKPAQPNEKVGSTFQMDINLNGGHDVFAVPLQVHYDNSRLQLVNVDMATRRITNFLGRDGQAVALAHRDDGNGNVAIAVSRPPGTTGITGSGTVCVLTFKAKAPGNAQVAIMTPAIRNSRQQVLPAIGSDAVVHIQ